MFFFTMYVEKTTSKNETGAAYVPSKSGGLWLHIVPREVRYVSIQ